MPFINQFFPKQPLSTASGFVDLTGKEYVNLKVEHYVGVIKGKAHWYCRCKCGNTIVCQTVVLNRGAKSCGCLNDDYTRKANVKHGMKGTRTYRIWSGMRDRCCNSNSRDRENYGGRGITLCKRWRNFENFFEDMGEAPEGMTIERKDNDKGYSKENCRWATLKEQANNRRSNLIILHNGQSMTAAQIDELYGHPRGTTNRRHRRGEKDYARKSDPKYNKYRKESISA